MTVRKSDESLPPGWTVKVKVRKDGKKDKYYFDPLKEFKFKSRPEVFRYINARRVYQTKSKRRGGIARPSAKNLYTNHELTRSRRRITLIFVSTEKAVAKGLPSGWTKEIRVTKNKDKIRKDSYYTDPTGRYMFRSLKGVHRYLKDGKLDRRSFNPKHKKKSAVESNGKRFRTLPKSKKDISAIDKARRRIVWDAKVLDPKKGIKEDDIVVKCNINEQCVPARSKNGCETLKVESSKSRKRKETNLPCRSSKRIAGLKPDPTINELKVRRKPVKKKDSAETRSQARESCGSSEHDVGRNSKILDENVEEKSLALEELLTDPCIAFAIKTLTGNEVHSPAALAAGEEKADERKNGKIETPDAPIGEIWADPCIEFAIKTLIGDDIPIEKNLKKQ